MPLIPANQAVPAILQFLSVMMRPSDHAGQIEFSREFFGVILGESFARELIAPANLTLEGKRLIVDSPSTLKPLFRWWS